MKRLRLGRGRFCLMKRVKRVKRKESGAIPTPFLNQIVNNLSNFLGSLHLMGIY